MEKWTKRFSELYKSKKKTHQNYRILSIMNQTKYIAVAKSFKTKIWVVRVYPGKLDSELVLLIYSRGKKLEVRMSIVEGLVDYVPNGHLMGNRNFELKC